MVEGVRGVSVSLGYLEEVGRDIGRGILAKKSGKGLDGSRGPERETPRLSLLLIG